MDNWVVVQEDVENQPGRLFMVDAARRPFDQESALNAAEAFAASKPGRKVYVAKIEGYCVAQRPVSWYGIARK